MNLDKFTADGKFLMLALDHRGSIKKIINPKNPNSVSDQEVIQFKNNIIEALKDQFSSLLIDETWGLQACHEVCQVKSYLLPLEKGGYIDQAGEKITELEYSVEQLKNMGASGAKLLIYFNPHINSAKNQLETARKVVEECKNEDFPLFLEIVTYTVGEDQLTAGKAGLVIESLRSFYESNIIPDVWKLEYPGNYDACLEITKMAGDTPWILLTGGSHFDDFKWQLEEVSKAGAKGFLAGRALWQELGVLEGEDRREFLTKTLPERFKTIADISKMY